MRILTATLALLMLAPLALAEECVPTTTTGAIAVGDYYVYDACADMTGEGTMECGWWGPWVVWIYEESNGIAGLQRADELRDDTCHGEIAGDTVIF